MQKDRIIDHLQRERQCLAQAEQAPDNGIRQLHLDLAKLHADKRRELEDLAREDDWPFLLKSVARRGGRRRP